MAEDRRTPWLVETLLTLDRQRYRYYGSYIYRCMIPIPLGKHDLDFADNTDHTDHTDYTDHADQEPIWPVISRS